MLASMRGLIVLGLGFAVAYWADQHYCDGRYSRETGNMIGQIEARSGQWLAASGWGLKRLREIAEMR
jgi:hypothetical protein